MFSVVLFISGGEIFIILLAILIFFGADRIPEFARIMGKGVREFRKATDDIKREFSENTSGVLDDIKSIGNDMSDTLTGDIAKPVQETVDETVNTFEEYQNQYNEDYYYNNPDYSGSGGNEYQAEVQSSDSEKSIIAGNEMDAYTIAGHSEPADTGGGDAEQADSSSKQENT